MLNTNKNLSKLDIVYKDEIFADTNKQTNAIEYLNHFCIDEVVGV